MSLEEKIELFLYRAMPEVADECNFKAISVKLVELLRDMKVLKDEGE